MAGLDPSTAAAILQRQSAVMKDLGASTSGLLSKAQQLSRYKQLSGDTSWVQDALAGAKHPAHRQLLRIVQDHGFDGLGSYINAMQELAGSKGGRGRR